MEERDADRGKRTYLIACCLALPPPLSSVFLSLHFVCSTSRHSVCHHSIFHEVYCIRSHSNYTLCVLFYCFGNEENFAERPTFKCMSVALLLRFQFTSCTRPSSVLCYAVLCYAMLCVYTNFHQFHQTLESRLDDTFICVRQHTNSHGKYEMCSVWVRNVKI